MGRCRQTTILHAGIFNLGFVAVSRSARLLDWWCARLRRDCIVDVTNARFVDQRWVDLVVGMFDHRVLEIPGLTSPIGICLSESSLAGRVDTPSTGSPLRVSTSAASIQHDPRY